jgi:hypothetical protein
LEADLDRELRYDMDRRVDDMMKNGSSEAEARRQASIEFGGVAQIQEEVRDTWIWRWLDALVFDVRYSIRGLVKSWGFALGTGTVLALGIGATIAIFSVVNTVLLQPLPYPDAERIVSVETLWTNTGRASQNVSGPDFLDWQAQNDVFERMAVSFGYTDEAVIVGDRAIFANAAFVSAEFFAVFGQTASAGRLLAEDDIPEEYAAHGTVAVVAYHWAATHFGSADAAIGKTITVYGGVMEIVGVAAPGFRYPDSTDIWVPDRTTHNAHNRSDHTYQAVGKLRGDVDVTRGQAQMRTIGDRLAQQYPENRFKSVTVIPLQERLTGNLQPTLWVLMSAVGVVWLIACANIANLLLARAAGRTREIALRAALGAGRGRVVRQLLTESCVLAAAAGLAGLLLASTLVRALAALSPANLPGIDELRMDTPSSCSRSGSRCCRRCSSDCAGTAWLAARPVGCIEAGWLEGDGTRAGARLRSALVVAEVALSVILLITAGLLLRSFQTLQHVDLGFTKSRVLVAYTEYAVRDGIRRTSGLETGSMKMCSIVCVPCPGSVRRRASPSLAWDGSPDRLATSTFKADRRDDRASGRKPSSTRSRRTTSRRWRFRFVPVAISTGPTHRGGRRSSSSTTTWHARPFQGSRPLDSAFGRERVPGRPGWRSSGCRRHALAGSESTRAGGDLRRIVTGLRQLAGHPGSDLGR